jgi:hypothetical protein
MQKLGLILQVAKKIMKMKKQLILPPRHQEDEPRNFWESDYKGIVTQNKRLKQEQIGA